MIITIDGPAGAGKTTVAKGLAKRLSIAYLDTGATYRAVTLAAIQAGVDLKDDKALAELAERIDLRLDYTHGDMRVILNGSDVSEQIRSSEVSEKSHYIARCPKVRGILVNLQRRIAKHLLQSTGGVVAEGRDQGTVVFPDADLKFYLDASCQVRADRRYKEMLSRGQQADYQQVLQAIRTRDERDRSREVAPLTKPPDAIEIDTTNMTADEVVEKLYQYAKAVE